MEIKTVMKWINDGIAMLTGAMVAALLVEAAHVPNGLNGLGGVIDWTIVAAGFAAIVDNALNGPARLALAIGEALTGLESKIEHLERSIEEMTEVLEER
jgi:hypothetical protein